ncbi:MAG: U32 family peptidase [Oscillospiraceae bacterium]|nr:U32 family peptidase [Oscillospiraceae bacterium]
MRHELLSPAGDMQSLKAAIRFGADAVYCGGPLLQLRAEKAGFSQKYLAGAVAYAHTEGKKLYVTVNSFAKNAEIPLVRDYAKELFALGADAAIVSDLGVLAAMKESVPELPVHISTQANCCNFMAARTYYNMGAERVVLAREMTIEEIAELRAKVPKELALEAFVHGAMCMAFSGRCLISSYFNNRSGNRGECTQPCRWSYYLVEQKRPDEYLELEESGGVSAVLSSHDLNCLAFLDKLRDAGVSSFKIEGRMKTPYYVATVTNAYRRRIDNSAPLEALEQELLCTSHRPYSSGFYFGELVKNHFNDGIYRQNCTFVGVVKAWENGRLTLEQRNAFYEGDELEILSPHHFGVTLLVNNIENSKGERVNAATLVQETVSVDCPLVLEPGDMLRKRTNNYDT